MRILHTSDWHLGQHFMGKSRQAEHHALIDWMLDQVQTQAVDAVLIAGDIFDTGTPPSYAREQYSRLVLGMHALGVPLILLAGNHDSVATLQESAGLLQPLGATVIAASGPVEGQVLLLNDREGRPGCLLCAIPFVRPREVVRSEAGQSGEDKQRGLQQAIQAYYMDVYQAAAARRDAIEADTGRHLPIIGSGHLTTVGASATESVREIYVGSLEAFPTAAFPPLDYLALGHIHRPQKVGGLEHVRYCGSPLPLSFDEASQRKQMLLVDLDAQGLCAVTELPVPRFQPLRSIDGDLHSLPARLTEVAAEGSADRPVWLEITVARDDYLADLPARLQALAEHLPVEILRIRRQRAQAAGVLPGDLAETLDALGHAEVFARRLDAETLEPALRAELERRYRRIVAELEPGV
ncbi:exonuclease subunit SbcD [Frateuria aurantia]